MAVVVTTEKSDILLTAIKDKIDSEQVKTWSYDKDGKFTLTSPLWLDKAWFRPVVSKDALTFVILYPPKASKGRVVYGVYHGQIIEMLLNHFDRMFDQVCASAMPQTPDE